MEGGWREGEMQVGGDGGREGGWGEGEREEGGGIGGGNRRGMDSREGEASVALKRVERGRAEEWREALWVWGWYLQLQGLR